HFAVTLAGGDEVDAEAAQAARHGAHRWHVRFGRRQDDEDVAARLPSWRSQRRLIVEERYTHGPAYDGRPLAQGEHDGSEPIGLGLCGGGAVHVGGGIDGRVETA